MPRLKSAEQIDAIKKQKSDLDKKLKEAQKKARLEDRELAKLRQKTAGHIILAEIEKNPEGEIAKLIRQLLNDNLKKPSDRTLFGLDPLPSEPTAIPQQDAA